MVLLQRKTIAIARAMKRNPPTAIPAMAAVGSPVWCGASTGKAVEDEVDVDVFDTEVEVDETELDIVELETAA